MCSFLFFFVSALPVRAVYHFSGFQAHSPIHILSDSHKNQRGMTPDQIKKIYHLPQSGGHGTIVIIGAYDDRTLESDLKIFNKRFSLPECSLFNGCLEIRKMNVDIKPNKNWSLETSLDVEWAHAIAPQAKILLVEATTPSGDNLLKAIDYAASRPDAISISLSWGGNEFIEETSLDTHFVSVSGAPFFAASGDNGTGTSWPATSPNVIGVGGTSLHLKKDGSLSREVAWSNSGGGISVYEPQPSFQKEYSIRKSHGMRAVPDVSYDADPQSGFPIVYKNIWHTVGGTSAGAPQWAAIAALGSGISNLNLYKDKASQNYKKYFRDTTPGLMPHRKVLVFVF